MDKNKKQHTLRELKKWELLLKRMVWAQLGEIKNQKILDFGSGPGITANHFAKENQVVAIEPSEEIVEKRWQDNPYEQLVGSLEQLRKLEDASFDVVFCHNVLEYAADREEIVREFYRVLKPGGQLSIIKHNRFGRVMQMAVLLNEFEKVNDLLDKKDGMSSEFGVIRYYEDADIVKWCEHLTMEKVYGIRTFWDLQQNQEIQEDAEWQEKMLQIEMRVSEIEDFQNIAFFHHLLLRK